MTKLSEKLLSPFGKMQLQLENISAETDTEYFNFEPKFSFEDSLHSSKRQPEYWDRLGSSKPCAIQKVLSKVFLFVFCLF